MNNKKIFHGPLNIAGKAYNLAKAQRNLGYYSKAICLSTTFAYPVDELFEQEKSSTYLAKYDIFNFYYGYGLNGFISDEIKLMKSMGKKLFFFFVGCDIRNSKHIIKHYDHSACKSCWPMLCKPLQQHQSIEVALKYANTIFVSTPDLLEFIPNAIWLPQPIDIQHIHMQLKEKNLSQNFAQEKNSDSLSIVHSPSSMDIKGTAYIRETIQQLTLEGYKLNLIINNNKKHTEVLQTILEADIVIDQLLIGAYGTYSAEGMLLAKPVICYIREDLIELYPDSLPIVNANKDTLYVKLKELIDSTALRKKLGSSGIEYVNTFHCHHKVAQTLLSAYFKD